MSQDQLKMHGVKIKMHQIYLVIQATVKNN
jgi:hypothetical protein